MKIVVIYHKSDFDGIFCREIARKFSPEGTEFIGWEYGEPTPQVDSTSDLFILDLSVPELMTHPKLVWIDHHKSAIEKYSNNIPGYRIDGVAACRLAWQWFQAFKDWNHMKQCFPYLPDRQRYIDRAVKEPRAVRLAGEYDIWDKRDPDAELFQYGLRSRELTESVWRCLLVNESYTKSQKDIGSIIVDDLLEAGKCLQYAKTKENASIIKASGFTRTFEGLTLLCCNHARFNSFLFTAGIREEHDALLGFNWTGSHWKISLYHAPGKEHHDLALIATKYGGGGHKGACGFTCKELPFNLIA